jgi:hypothetical protein
VDHWESPNRRVNSRRDLYGINEVLIVEGETDEPIDIARPLKFTMSIKVSRGYIVFANRCASQSETIIVVSQQSIASVLPRSTVAHGLQL